MVGVGFGFLSENGEFAQKCEKAGLIFIGPSAYSIGAMGSKSEAKMFLKGIFTFFPPIAHLMWLVINRLFEGVNGAASLVITFT